MLPHIKGQNDGNTVEEEEYQDSEEEDGGSSGEGSPGAREKMEENLREFNILPEAEDEEDEEMIMRNEFKASFISHICNVKD